MKFDPVTSKWVHNEGTFSVRNVLSYCEITMMPLLDTRKKLCAYANTVRLEETFAHNIAYLYLGVRSDNGITSMS